MAKYRITASPSHGSKGYETLWIGQTPHPDYRGVAEGIIKAVDNYQTSYERNRRKMK